MKNLFVCNNSSDCVSVVNTEVLKEECKIFLNEKELGKIGPHGICKYKNNLLIANNYGNSLSLINLSNKKLEENYFIGMNCNDVKVFNDRAFVICGDSNNIVSYDLQKNKIDEEIPCGNLPHSIDINIPRNALITADMDSDTITVIDYKDLSCTKSIRVGAYPTKAIFHENGSQIIVCESNIGSSENGSISIYNIYGLKLINRIQVGNAPVDMFCEGSYCFVSNFGDGTVSIVDLNKFIEIKKIKVGGMPRGIVKNKKNIFVGDNYNNLLLCINIENEEKKAISIGGEPTGMVFL